MGHLAHARSTKSSEREFLIDNLLVRIHYIIKIILVDRPCTMGVLIPFSIEPNIHLPVASCSLLASRSPPPSKTPPTTAF